MAGAETNSTRRPSAGVSLLGDVIGTVAVAIYGITTAVSFAALVFTGPAAAGLPRGASTFVLATGVFTLFLGVRSRFTMVFGMVQDTAAIVLVPAVATIAASSSDDAVRDVLVVLGLSSALTGIAMWGLGHAHLASTARFVPTTVVSGFLGGTGWLLLKGGFDVMADTSLELGDLGDLFGTDLAKLWLPGAVLGIVIAVIPLLPRVSPVVASAVAILMTAGFFVVVAVASSISAVEEGGWLVGPFPEGGSIGLIGPELVAADWPAVGETAGTIGVVLLLSVLGVLLNLSGLQVVTRSRIDLDQELKTAGIANLLVAPIGGLVGYHALGDTVLATRLGLARRAIPIAVGLIAGIFAFAGGELVGYLPRFTAGGLLIGAGLGLLIEWGRGLRSSGWSDRFVGVLIVAAIAFVGILEGIVVGLLAACLMFVLRYSRIDPIRLVSTGRERRSVVERSPQDDARLDDLADRMAVYELHGSLFFGSVSGVAEKVRKRLAHTSSPIDVVIVDFARVADIDSSAFAVLAELGDDASAAGTRLIWSDLSSAATAVLVRADTVDDGAFADDLDAALERGEDLLLAADIGGPPEDDAPNEPYSDSLLDWFVPESRRPGEMIVREGDESDELFLVVTGSVHVSRTGRDGRELRLRTLRAGAIIGEIGFLTGGTRTATVTAETDVEVRVLTSKAHQRLRAEQPDLVIELYDRVLRSTADRAAAIHRSLTQALR